MHRSSAAERGQLDGVAAAGENVAQSADCGALHEIETKVFVVDHPRQPRQRRPRRFPRARVPCSHLSLAGRRGPLPGVGGFGDGFKERVTEALLKLDDPALLESFPRSGFIPASNDDYEPIRATAENIGILD